MRVVFAGTPDFSVPCLDALSTHPQVEVVGVYTQPDRPAGRGKKIQQSPVKQRALALGYPVFQPLSFKLDDDVEALAALDIDLMVVTAYGIILPQKVLDIPTYGCVNVHASLLPRWRGAAPIQRAIEHGDEVTGVTLMQMEAGLDTGPMLAKIPIDIEPNHTASSLHDALSLLGGRILSENLSALQQQSLTAEPQDDTQACYARKLHKSQSPVNWRDSAIQIDQKVRAFNPWPMATVCFDGVTMKVHQSSVQQGNDGEPGQVVSVDHEGISVQTGDGRLRLEVLQKPGGKAMTAAALRNGFAIEPNLFFDTGNHC